MAERCHPLTRLANAIFAATLATGAGADDIVSPKEEGAVRIATFNASLSRAGAGVLIRDLRKGTPQIAAVTEILRRVRPDIVLVNEIDHDPDGLAVTALVELLKRDGPGGDGLSYPYVIAEPVNTGVPTGHDLDADGHSMGPADAHGWGHFPGQFGMAILSTYPLGDLRSFRLLRWSAMPSERAPQNSDGTPYWAEEIWKELRLSSKSHWDVTADLPGDLSLHLLASHPTPPVFDGPEDRNGLRNAAEIRFWADYISGRDWMTDDEGRGGGLDANAPFVLLGDLNADPDRGESRRQAISDLLSHPRLTDPAPVSPGGAAAGAPGATADWRGGRNGPGALRVDYVLPSSGLKVTGSGVFWPSADDPLAGLVASNGKRLASSDHRLVWIDIRPAP